MQYYIGPSTWGSPIYWMREQHNESWIASNTRDIDPDDCVNWSSFEFALWLGHNVQVGDWLYNTGYMKTLGWYQVTKLDNKWCCHIGWDTLAYLNVDAHADAGKDIITFREGVQWQDKIRWKLYGF